MKYGGIMATKRSRQISREELAFEILSVFYEGCYLSNMRTKLNRRGVQASDFEIIRAFELIISQLRVIGVRHLKQENSFDPLLQGNPEAPPLGNGI